MCELYYKYNSQYYKLGTFWNQTKAEQFWKAIETQLQDKLGKNLQPIYIEKGKERGKCSK